MDSTYSGSLHEDADIKVVKYQCLLNLLLNLNGWLLNFFDFVFFPINFFSSFCVK